MAFELKNIKGATLEKVARTIEEKIAKSRFTAAIRLPQWKDPTLRPDFYFSKALKNKSSKITIHDVRLRKPKHYCGNHPLPCPVRPYERPHKKHCFLEGADWVAFNDMLNDVLDDLGVSANVASSLVVIRKGRARCVGYDCKPLANGIDSEWPREGCYEDFIGQPHPRSLYPEGTPGLYQWKP